MKIYEYTNIINFPPCALFADDLKWRTVDHYDDACDICQFKHNTFH